MNNEDQKDQEKQENIKNEPDVSAGLFIQSSLKISDPESGEVLHKIKG